MNYTFKKILYDPLLIIDWLLGSIALKYYTFRSKIVAHNSVRVIGLPLIDIRGKSKVILGKDVVLRSRNRGYHINMLAPCKLMTDPNGSIIIGDNSRIYGTCLHSSQGGIIIGKNCLIASNVNIIDRNGHDMSMQNPEKRYETIGAKNAHAVLIEDNVWIGANCIITPGVTIGEGSVIMANSVVNVDIPPKVLAGGVPSKVLKEY
ncbi:MAG: Acetyltransferase [uncultured Sulfurovum sp.]|uniref:Acetyltransferase n=1 Tax=uncultured Sulfurovum sp. TaxID=269237 RepID=A0A6S6TWC2_9BACT|nr:MAG: Acetyltransferase [uncultured Sulfurovum sp.]